MLRPRPLAPSPAALPGGQPSSPLPRFRPATPADAPAIRRLVWGARMNPLALDPARFLVADAEGGGSPAPGTPPSSPSLAAVGQVIPLPLSPAPAAGPAVEIRSLVVAPQLRGAGLGTALLAALLATVPPSTGAVWLTTLAGRAPFYERAGFRIVDGGRWRGEGSGEVGGCTNDGSPPPAPPPPPPPPPPVPAAMRLEVLAGSVVGPLLGGDRLVVMCKQRRREGGGGA